MRSPASDHASSKFRRMRETEEKAEGERDIRLGGAEMQGDGDRTFMTNDKLGNKWI